MPITSPAVRGADILRPGLGSDNVTGGPGADIATYEDRASPVTLSLDGQPNDGHSDEHDLLQADVEDLIGGTGDDTLTGNADANDMTATRAAT